MDSSTLPRDLIRVRGDHEFFRRELRNLGYSKKGGYISIHHQEGVLCFIEVEKGKLRGGVFLSAVLTERDFLLMEVKHDMPRGEAARRRGRRAAVRHALPYARLEAVSRGFAGHEEGAAAGRAAPDQIQILNALARYGAPHSVHVRVEARRPPGGGGGDGGGGGGKRRGAGGGRPPPPPRRRPPGGRGGEGGGLLGRLGRATPGRRRSGGGGGGGGEEEGAAGAGGGEGDAALTATGLRALFSAGRKKRGGGGGGGMEEGDGAKKKPTMKPKESRVIVLHLLTFEPGGALLARRLRAQWHGAALRRALRIPAAPRPSDPETAARYVAGVRRAVLREPDDLAVVALLQELCAELQADPSARAAFFAQGLAGTALQLVEDAAGALWSAERPPSWEEVYRQLELAAAALGSLHAALFGPAGEGGEDRRRRHHALLRPDPLTFDEMIELLLQDYTAFVPASYADELMNENAKATPRRDDGEDLSMGTQSTTFFAPITGSLPMSMSDGNLHAPGNQPTSAGDGKKSQEGPSTEASCGDSAKALRRRQLLLRNGPVPLTPAGEPKDPLLEPSRLPVGGSFSPLKGGGAGGGGRGGSEAANSLLGKTVGTRTQVFLRYLRGPLEDQDAGGGGGAAMLAPRDNLAPDAMQKLLAALVEEVHDTQVALLVHAMDLLGDARADPGAAAGALAEVDAPSCLPTRLTEQRGDGAFEGWASKLVARVVSLVDEADAGRRVVVGKAEGGRPLRLPVGEASAYRARRGLAQEQMGVSIDNAYRLDFFGGESGSSDSDSSDNSSSSSGSSESEKSQQSKTRLDFIHNRDGLIGRGQEMRRLKFLVNKSGTLRAKHDRGKVRIDREVLRAREEAALKSYENERALAAVALHYHARLLHGLAQDAAAPLARERLRAAVGRDIREVLSTDAFLEKLIPISKNDADSEEEGSDDEAHFFNVYDQLNVYSLKLLLRLIHLVAPDIEIELG